MRRGVYVAPFDELSEPALVADLAARAEARGWGRLLRMGPRRLPRARARRGRPVDHARRGGAGHAASDHRAAGHAAPPPAPTPARTRDRHARPPGRRPARARCRLGQRPHRRVRPGPLRRGGRSARARAAAGRRAGAPAAYWDGEFEPRPAGRIPVWVAVRWPSRRPLRRAARQEGVFPIDLPGPEALAEVTAELPVGDGYDVVVTNPAGTDPAPWAAAGATWCLTGFGMQPTA